MILQSFCSFTKHSMCRQGQNKSWDSLVAWHLLMMILNINGVYPNKTRVKYAKFGLYCVNQECDKQMAVMCGKTAALLCPIYSVLQINTIYTCQKF